MPSASYRNLADHLASGAINFKTASFKCMLLSAVPSESDLDTHIFRSSIATEITGTGYTSGGVAVTATVSAVDTTNNRVSITFSNLAPGWSTATLTAVCAVVYVNVGSAATDKLVSLVDFAGTVSSTAGNYSVTFSAPIYITTP